MTTSGVSTAAAASDCGISAAAMHRYAAKQKVFVGSIAQTTAAGAVRAAFAQFGPVEAVHISVHQQTQRSRGYGFVAFRDADGAATALANRFVLVDGSYIEVRSAEPRRHGGGAVGSGFGRLGTLGNAALHAQAVRASAAEAAATPAPPELRATAAEWVARADEAHFALPPPTPFAGVAGRFWALWWPDAPPSIDDAAQ